MAERLLMKHLDAPGKWLQEKHRRVLMNKFCGRYLREKHLHKYIIYADKVADAYEHNRRLRNPSTTAVNHALHGLSYTIYGKPDVRRLMFDVFDFEQTQPKLVWRFNENNVVFISFSLWNISGLKVRFWPSFAFSSSCVLSKDDYWFGSVWHLFRDTSDDALYLSFFLSFFTHFFRLAGCGEGRSDIWQNFLHELYTHLALCKVLNSGELHFCSYKLSSMKSSVFHFPSNNLKSLDIIWKVFLMLPLLVLTFNSYDMPSVLIIFSYLFPCYYVSLLNPDACAASISQN